MSKLNYKLQPRKQFFLNCENDKCPSSSRGNQGAMIVERLLPIFLFGWFLILPHAVSVTLINEANTLGKNEEFSVL